MASKPHPSAPLARGLRSSDGTEALLYDSVADGEYLVRSGDTITGSAGGGSGAPTNASYVVIGLNGSLSAERVLTAGTGLTLTDGGANGNATLAPDFGSGAGKVCEGNDARLTDRRDADAIYETGGPTTLTVGAVADGAILARSGTTVVGTATPALTSLALSSYLDLTIQGSHPSAPGAGVGRVYLREIGAGGALPYLRRAVGPAMGLGLAPWGRTFLDWSYLYGNSGGLSTGGWTWTLSGSSMNNGAKAAGSVLSSMLRGTYTTATTANATGGLRTTQPVAWRGNAARLGGFLFYSRFAISQNSNGSRAFIGLAGATGATVVSADPSALVDCVGMGFDDTDADTGNWYLIHNDGSGTATKVDLGANAARNTTDVFELYLYAEPNGSAIEYLVYNLSTDTLAAEGTLSSDLPTNTVFLTAHQSIGAAATGVSQKIELSRCCCISDI